jgi:4-hydroxy-tetrahydrodipicolinate synthase
MESRYLSAKEVFIDSVDIDDYIDLESSKSAKSQLMKSLEKPLKMILLFGRPGTGKSILLNQIYHQLKHQRHIHYFETPMTDEHEFLPRIFKAVTLKDLPPNTRINYSALVDYCRSIHGEREVIILLDEAQMYNEVLMERIRLLSDTRAVKFVVSLHKTEDEDLVAKEHFQTRIWESIELHNASMAEMQSYVHKKLLKKNLFEIANIVRRKHIALIHRLTSGNFRQANKLLYTVFEIYEYYDKHHTLKISHDKFSSKIIEMAAIKLGLLHA